MQTVDTLILALALGDRRTADQQGPVLLTALREVEAYYAPVPHPARFRLAVVGASEHEARAASASWARQVPVLQIVIDWDVLTGGPWSRTIDQQLLWETVSERLPIMTGSTCIAIVTDLELTPPPNFRYILKDHWDRAAVISAGPADPDYWGDRSRPRFSILKHRVRAMCLSAVGSWLGLETCNNRVCFMFGPVDSVSQVDDMVKLGTEHRRDGQGFKDLIRYGYRVKVNHPRNIQPVEMDPPTG